MKLKLYHYWRSSSSWRVRWALNLKKVSCEYIHVNVLNGETESPEHLARNPLGFVPALEIDGTFLTESLAMIQWLEDTHPTPSLLGKKPLERAKIWQLAETINASTQPLQNLNPQFLHSDDPEKRKTWAVHWNKIGLQAYETLCKASAGKFSVGDQLTAADLCLIPQCYNAKRYEIDIAKYPTIHRIYQSAIQEPSYTESAPERYQPPEMK